MSRCTLCSSLGGQNWIFSGPCHKYIEMISGQERTQCIPLFRVTLEHIMKADLDNKLNLGLDNILQHWYQQLRLITFAIHVDDNSPTSSDDERTEDRCVGITLDGKLWQLVHCAVEGMFLVV
uniref:Uncharacterized protein n=1 Tax=Eutreptiella gymnastica TaxID=73025 RepID=A0A7S1IW99_9EUGL